MSEKIFGLNIADSNPHARRTPAPAKVAIFALASDFGCQLQITNIEDSLLDILGMFELVYWQMASSGPMPDDFDVAIIEGAVCTQEHVELLKKVREIATDVIAIGACAVTGGIPGLATNGYETRIEEVYGQAPATATEVVSPRPVSAVIDVDYLVPGCPIEPLDFVNVLQRALLGAPATTPRTTMCGSCRINERECFLQRGTLCLGLVTRKGCDARCVAAGRPCNGCRGISPDANLKSARDIVKQAGIDPALFDERLALFNVYVDDEAQGA